MITWLALAGAVALVPVPRLSGSREHPGMSPRVREAIVATCVALIAVLLLPLTAGMVAAAAVAPLAVLALRRVTSRPHLTGPGPSLPFVLCLAAAALRSGASTVTALEAALPAAEDGTRDTLGHVIGLLRLGASTEQAWATVPPSAGLGSIAAAARRSEVSGIKLAQAFERAAADLVATRHAAARARAERVGVLAVGPLGLCFLPAFVCLGIVPVLIALIGGAQSSVRTSMPRLVAMDTACCQSTIAPERVAVHGSSALSSEPRRSHLLRSALSS